MKNNINPKVGTVSMINSLCKTQGEFLINKDYQKHEIVSFIKGFAIEIIYWFFNVLAGKNKKGEIYMKTFIIKYYLTETAYRGGVPAFTETVRGDRNTAVNRAQNRIRTSNFKFYDIQEQ